MATAHQLMNLEPVCKGLGVKGGVEGRLLSADRDLLGTTWEGVGNVLLGLGDGKRLATEGVDGEGDLYLETTSLVRGRRVVVAAFAVALLFRSAGTKGGLGVSSTAMRFSNSHTSIKHCPN
ncbi:hypothetical protein OIU85_012424 [Salix viminalis]|uniref:Uncharacterized protein n=1 Tax=Salix viminalis TaxID=40686 RepID=A0A9Q0NPA1_SALVM|nr:hypothetical protein OIU85_012424 [Salix viminalis]